MYVNVCGNPAKEVMDGRRARWPLGTVVKYFEDLSFDGLDRREVAAAYDAACAHWSAVCGLQFRRVDDPRRANIVARVGGIDGAWGVLAQSELPYSADANSSINQVFDSEPWSSEGIEMLTACMGHEIGHAIGLEHMPGTGALMEPIIVPGRVMPQAPDAAEAQVRYGPPAPARPPGEDFGALGESLSPYVLGPMCDGLVAAALRLESGGSPSEADEAMDAKESSLRRSCFDAIVGPHLTRLDPRARARAYREIAAGLARKIT